MTMTIEQKRADHAWKCAEGMGDDYSKLAKGLPSLIMNSGLMQVMAFMEERKKEERYKRLAEHLRAWLGETFPKLRGKSDLTSFMNELLKLESKEFQAVTEEALAWLKWLRLMAAARVRSGGGQAGRN